MSDKTKQVSTHECSRSAWGAGILSIGIVISSIVVGSVLYKTISPCRYVTVKGLSERKVDADRAVLKIGFVVAQNDLSRLHSEVKRQGKEIAGLLQRAGFSKEEFSIGMPTIQDRREDSYYGRDGRNPDQSRFKANAEITVDSAKVNEVKRVAQQWDKLLERGIVLDRGYNALRFFFTKLNEIKPEMIQEATLKAREVADQFARDSNSKVGEIRHANQGAFSINDSMVPDVKTVRVVTTVEYFLR